MEILKNFAVFEGCDGSGTTTQINILEGFFLQNRHLLPPFHITFEPTNSSIGKLIRLSLQKELNFTPKTIALLFAADRCEHVYGLEGIAERCGRGELVVSDRYLPSSLVYQGITCGEELPKLLNRDFPVPELLLFLDIDPKIAQKRMADREHKEIYETPDFQMLVRKRYLSLLPYLSDQGVRVETIDASLPPEEAAREVWKAMEKMPILKR
jgi:dTMP kinase